MLPDSCIGFDGSWSHRRNADHCLVDLIDTRTNKVVDFEVVTRTRAREGDFVGSSNAMECEGLRRMIPRWKHFARVTAYVHDKDAKTRKVICESGWQIQEKIDMNHLMKSFRRKFKKFQARSPTRFRGLKGKLEAFFRVLLHLDETNEWKKWKWCNAVNHFAGDHSDCPAHGEAMPWRDIDVGENRQLLTEFLEKTAQLFDKCDPRHSTQMCESLHAVKAHYANKLYAWQTSWAARICAAILSVNEVNWAMMLYERLGLPPLDRTIVTKLQNFEQTRAQQQERRRLDEYRRRRNARRKERRQKDDKDNEHSLYKGVQKDTVVNDTVPRKRGYKIRKMPKVLGRIHPYFRERFGFDGTDKDDVEIEDQDGVEQEFDYSGEEEEEEEYSEYFWDESELLDIRNCIRDIHGLPDKLITETTTNDQ